MPSLRRGTQLFPFDICNSLSFSSAFEYSFSSWQRYFTQKKLALSFKCYKTDEFYSSDIQGTESQSYDSPVYSCKFGENNETNNLLALAYEDGRICIQKIYDSASQKLLAAENAHNNAIFELSWSHFKSQVLSASADTTVRLWNIEPSGKLVQNQVYRGHSKSVKCVDSSRWDPDVFASSGRDCSIVVWDTRCHPSSKSSEILGAHCSHKTIKSPNVSRLCSSQVQNSVISALFCEQYKLISAGASDGLLKIWDLRKTYSLSRRDPLSLHTLEYAGNSSCKGFTSLSLSPEGTRVYVSCLDGKIYTYHLISPTPKPITEYYGHRPKTYYVKACLSPCGSFLLSGSSDDKAYVWLTDYPGPPVSCLSGHLDEVTCVAWSPRTTGMVVTCSDDRHHRLFHLRNCDPSDFDCRQTLRGYAEPCDMKVYRSNCLRINKNSIAANSELDSSTVPNDRVQLTPQQSKTSKNQRTPKTSDHKTLLSWLSSSKKTPKTNDTPHTPQSASSSGKSRMTLKRKLTDIIDGNQENLQSENTKKVVSPSKPVLTETVNKNVPISSVSKMLSYESTFHSSLSSRRSLRTIEEETETFTIDKYQESNITENASVFRHNRTASNAASNSTPCKKSPEKSLKVNHLSPLNTSLLTSPTANLPNFVVDGTSPHNRQETPIPAKRKSDWLTSLSLRKNKFAESMEKLNGKSPQHNYSSRGSKPISSQKRKI